MGIYLIIHAALAYAARTYKTLTRDINELISMGILEKTPDGIRARKEKDEGFFNYQLTIINEKKRDKG